MCVCGRWWRNGQRRHFNTLNQVPANYYRNENYDILTAEQIETSLELDMVTRVYNRGIWDRIYIPRYPYLYILWFWQSLVITSSRLTIYTRTSYLGQHQPCRNFNTQLSTYTYDTWYARRPGQVGCAERGWEGTRERERWAQSLSQITAQLHLQMKGLSIFRCH